MDSFLEAFSEKLRTHFSKVKQRQICKNLNVWHLFEQLFKGRAIDPDTLRAKYQPLQIKEEEFSVVSSLFKKTLMKQKIKFPIIRQAILKMAELRDSIVFVPLPESE